MTDVDFHRIGEYVTSNYGIKLPYFKKTMLEGRLQKRLKATGASSFKEYNEFVFGESGKGEILKMIDAISTNKTGFFRESAHFDFLINRLLPEYVADNPQRTLKIWSAAASSGEEIYTTAFAIEEFISTMGQGKINYSILGTDISIEKLRQAISAVYEMKQIKHIPTTLRNKYFLRSRDRSSDTVRVVPAIRHKTRFQILNLMDAAYRVGNNFDAIFCRNVLIYFNRHDQGDVINKLCENLKTGGYFFLGHSESTIGKSVPLKQIIPTVYKKY